MTLINIWKGLGYVSIIFYVGILGISQEYFEAATIDGASKLQIIRKITIPLLTPLIPIMTLLSIGKIFYSDFGLFFFVPREIGQLYPVTQVIDTYVFRMLKVSGDIGMSTAVGLFQSGMGFIIVLLSNYVVDRLDFICLCSVPADTNPDRVENLFARQRSRHAPVHDRHCRRRLRLVPTGLQTQQVAARTPAVIFSKALADKYNIDASALNGKLDPSGLRALEPYLETVYKEEPQLAFITSLTHITKLQITRQSPASPYRRS